MALSAGALVPLEAAKVYAGLRGTTSRDDQMETAIEDASAMALHEGLGGRRGIYHGPVESYTTILSGHTIALGASVPVATGTPDSAGRTIVVRKTDADRSITAGTLTVTQASPALVETFDLASGDELHGAKFFTGAVTLALAGVVGAGSGDTLDVGTSAGYTELYSPNGCSALIRPIEYPVLSVAAVHEDPITRAFGPDTLLVAGTDFELRGQDTISRAIARVLAGRDIPWRAGRRGVQARMSAGWRGTAGVPRSVRGVVLELAAWFNAFSDGKSWGTTDRQDGTGNVTYSGPPRLTDELGARLSGEHRSELMPTAERGWSEVA